MNKHHVLSNNANHHNNHVVGSVWVSDTRQQETIRA